MEASARNRRAHSGIRGCHETRRSRAVFPPANPAIGAHEGCTDALYAPDPAPPVPDPCAPGWRAAEIRFPPTLERARVLEGRALVHLLAGYLRQPDQPAGLLGAFSGRPWRGT